MPSPKNTPLEGETFVWEFDPLERDHFAKLTGMPARHPKLFEIFFRSGVLPKQIANECIECPHLTIAEDTMHGLMQMNKRMYARCRSQCSVVRTTAAEPTVREFSAHEHLIESPVILVTQADDIRARERESVRAAGEGSTKYKEEFEGRFEMPIRAKTEDDGAGWVIKSKPPELELEEPYEVEMEDLYEEAGVFA